MAFGNDLQLTMKNEGSPVGEMVRWRVHFWDNDLFTTTVIISTATGESGVTHFGDRGVFHPDYPQPPAWFAQAVDKFLASWLAEDSEGEHSEA